MGGGLCMDLFFLFWDSYSAGRISIAADYYYSLPLSPPSFLHHRTNEHNHHHHHPSTPHNHNSPPHPKKESECRNKYRRSQTPFRKGTLRRGDVRRCRQWAWLDAVTDVLKFSIKEK